MSKRKPRVDAWENPYTALARNKVRDTRPVPSATLTTPTLKTLWRTDAIAGRGVSLVVDEAMRQGFQFVDEGNDAEAEDARALLEACKDWSVYETVAAADVWGRLYGLGAIWIGVDGAGQQSDELKIDRVRVGGLKFLRVLEAEDLSPARYDTDPMSPTWGEPSHWRVQAQGGGGAGSLNIVVHESRLIRFGGALTPRDVWLNNGCHDDSVLQRAYDVLQRAAVNLQSIDALLTDFSQGVFKIKDLVKILAADGNGVFAARMQLMEQTRASNRAIMVDADREDFTRVATPMTGAPEMIDRTWQQVASAFGMPVTKLLGMAPAGLNATGESDENNWNSTVTEHREKVLGPRIEVIARVIALSEGIAGADSLSLCWPPLRHETPSERADNRLKDSQRVKNLIDSGLVLADEAALSMFGKGKYSDEITIDVDVRQRMLEAELTKAEENAGKPDPVPPVTPPASAPVEPQPQDKPNGG